MQELNFVEVECVSGGVDGSAAHRAGTTLGEWARWVWDNRPQIDVSSDYYYS